MVVFAIQMLAFGNTPIGPFPRTWPMLGFGILFAVLGAVSCIIPGILVPSLTILVGVLNILGGVLGLLKMLPSKQRRPNELREPVPLILTKLFATQLILNLLTIFWHVDACSWRRAGARYRRDSCRKRVCASLSSSRLTHAG